MNEFRMPTIPVDVLLEMFDQPGPVSDEEWEFLKEVLSRILNYAAGFYDDYDYRHYEFALAVANSVLNGRSAEDVIQAMAGTAHFLLAPLIEDEAKEFSAETRARLEVIRDNHPEFAEFAEACEN